MAEEITAIYKKDGAWTLHVEFNKEEHRVWWFGRPHRPDLTTFPELGDGVFTAPVPQSAAVRELWAKSSLVCYGADSHIRLLDAPLPDAFPVCKVAVTPQQRPFVRDDFSLVRSLRAQGAPVVSVHPDPLVDEDGIFGFRMEQLVKVKPVLLYERLQDIYDVMDKIHAAGIVHNDFHPGNILERPDGTLVAIDFGRSGPVDHSIPPEKRCALWKEPTFSFEADKIVMEAMLSHTPGIGRPQAAVLKANPCRAAPAPYTHRDGSGDGQ